MDAVQSVAGVRPRGGYASVPSKMFLVWVGALAAAKGWMALVVSRCCDCGVAAGNRGDPHSSSGKNGRDDGSFAGLDISGDLGIAGRAARKQQRIPTTAAELVSESSSEIAFEAAR